MSNLFSTFSRLIEDFFLLFRLPNLLMIVLTQYLVRICLLGDRSNWLAYFQDVDFFLVVISTLCIAAAGYIINDYYDVKIDTINKPHRVVVGKSLDRRKAMFAHFFLNIVGIGLGSLLSLRLGAVNFLAGFLLWLYSNQLKRMPFIGNVCIALLTALSVLVVSVYFREGNLLIYIFALFAFFITLIREVIKDMEDQKGDRDFGCRTLPIVWGLRRTKSVIYGILGLFILSVIGLLYFIVAHSILTGYFLVMIIPATFFINRLARADTVKEYHFLSTFCKWIMLSGVLVMIWA